MCEVAGADEHTFEFSDHGSTRMQVEVLWAHLKKNKLTQYQKNIVAKQQMDIVLTQYLVRAERPQILAALLRCRFLLHKHSALPCVFMCHLLAHLFDVFIFENNLCANLREIPFDREIAKL